MATIANLNAKLGLSANGFFSAINKVKNELKSTKTWASKLTSGFGGVGTAIAGLGIGAAAAGFGAFVRSNMESVDSLSKLSAKLGITTEALGGLKYAGDLANVPLETLGAGIAKMSKNLGEAVNGSSSAQATFDSLGLSFTELASMAPDAAFAKIADRLNQIENPAQRTAAIMDVFGKSGLELNGVLSLGSEGIATYSKEAEKLGLIFSGIEGREVEAANDSITTLLKLVTALGQRVAIEVAPFIRQLNADIVGFATSGSSATEIVSKGFSFLTDTISYLGNAVDLLKIPFKSMQIVFNSVIGASAKQLEYMLKGIRKIAELAGANDIANSIKGWEDATKSFGDGMFDNAKDNLESIKEVFTGPQAGEALQKWFDNAKRNSKELATVAENTGRAIDTSLIDALEGKGVSDKLKDTGKELASIFDDLQGKLDNLNLSPVDALAKKIQDAGGDFFDVLDGWKLLAQIQDSEAKKLAEENRIKSFDTGADLAAKGVDFLSVTSNRGQAIAAGFGSTQTDKAYLEARKQSNYLELIAKNTTPTTTVEDYYEGL